jgi:hypothetical protein
MPDTEPPHSCESCGCDTDSETIYIPNPIAMWLCTDCRTILRDYGSGTIRQLADAEEEYYL